MLHPQPRWLRAGASDPPDVRWSGSLVRLPVSSWPPAPREGPTGGSRRKACPQKPRRWASATVPHWTHAVPSTSSSALHPGYCLPRMSTLLRAGAAPVLARRPRNRAGHREHTSCVGTGRGRPDRPAHSHGCSRAYEAAAAVHGVGSVTSVGLNGSWRGSSARPSSCCPTWGLEPRGSQVPVATTKQTVPQ